MIDYKNGFVNFMKAITVIFLFFLYSFARTYLLKIFGIDYASLSIILKEGFNLITEIILLILIYLIYQNEFDKAFEDLKKNHWKYFKGSFKYYLIGLILMYGSNIIINYLGGNLSNNEQAVRSEFEMYPYYTYFMGVFLAPILEESVFRLSFRSLIKNKTLYVLISGFVFGLMHLTGVLNSPYVLLYLISYSGCGLAFAYMMSKYNNIFVSMGYHMMHNGILMTIQLMMLIF